MAPTVKQLRNSALIVSATELRRAAEENMRDNGRTSSERSRLNDVYRAVAWELLEQIQD